MIWVILGVCPEAFLENGPERQNRIRTFASSVFVGFRPVLRPAGRHTYNRSCDWGVCERSAISEDAHGAHDAAALHGMFVHERFEAAVHVLSEP